MSAHLPRRRSMPKRKDMQRALKESKAPHGERITARVFLLFSLLVIVSGWSMWQDAPETHIVSGMFMAIGVICAVVSFNWGK